MHNISYILMEYNQNPIITKLRCIASAGAAVNKWKKLANRAKDRYYRLRELVNTEQDYRKDLISIIEKIQNPLLQEKIIDEEDAVRMFPNVQSMIGLSVQLREELHTKFQSWDRRKTLIGQTMIRFSKFLLVYSDFFKNFNESQKKLKVILATNEKARLIEKKLSTQNRIITFQDLMSKPFQRPLKYHLILRDYASKVQKTHPDYNYLQQAIECYHKVNQQNNLSLENKEKDQMLMILDNRFGNIIEAEARYFVKEFEAIYIDSSYNMYILSDMVILAQKSTTYSLRIHFNKYSYVQRPPDGHLFVNRLFFYGKSYCVHLSFFDSSTSDEVYCLLKKLILEANQNQSNRQEMILQRTTRQSLVQRRRSFTNLQPQFKRPLVIRVVGSQKRFLSSDKVDNKFIIEFHSTPPKFNDPTSPHQISYVSLQTLLRIENFGRVFYKQQQFANIFPIQSRTRDLTEYQYKKNENKRIQLQSLFIQLFLNSIYRNQKILKRIDFVSYLLKVSESLWLQLHEKYNCLENSCTTHGKTYQNFKDYFGQLQQRQFFQNKIDKSVTQRMKKKYFCDIRTIQMQQMLASFPPEKLKQSGVRERVAWIKSKLGWINHAYTNPKPQYKKILITVYLSNVYGNDNFNLEIFTSYTAKHVLWLIEKRLNTSLQDYALAANINGKIHVMFDDEIVGELMNMPKQQGGFFGFFKSENYAINLFIKKVWCLQLPLELRENDTKLVLQVQQIIYRLKSEQIKLAVEQCIAVYAFYYSYKHFIELDTLTLNKLKMKNQQFSKFINPSLRSSLFYEKIYSIIERLKQDKTLLSSRMIMERIIEFLSDKPGWITYMFNGILFGNGKQEGIQVRIGCDIKGVKVQEKSKRSVLFEFKFQENNWECRVNGFELVIKQQNQYSFFGRDLWKVKYQVDFYRLYSQSFPLKTHK